MFGSEVIDVGIGIALMFFFMSLTATALVEFIENFVKSRAKNLEKGIDEIFRDVQVNGSSAAFVAEFYKHPLIASLYAGEYERGSRNLPSYIPRQNFSFALLDIVAKSSEGLSIETLKASLQPNGSGNNAVKQLLLSAINVAGDDIDRTRKILEDWYDGTMDRVSGWYKRRTGIILAVIGFASAAFFNVDAITVTKSLISDKDLRQAVVAQASKVTGPDAPAAGAKTVDDLSQELAEIGFPVGWQRQGDFFYPKPQSCKTDAASKQTTCTASGFLVALPGWIVTALGVMLGSPLWFDVLNKLMVIRSTVKPKEKSPDESSEDRQTSSSPLKATAMPPATPAWAAHATEAAHEEADQQAAFVASTMAINANAFVPHEWANKQDKQEGVL